jgi:hypothetical protein
VNRALRATSPAASATPDVFLLAQATPRPSVEGPPATSATHGLLTAPNAMTGTAAVICSALGGRPRRLTGGVP